MELPVIGPVAPASAPRRARGVPATPMFAKFGRLELILLVISDTATVVVGNELVLAIVVTAVTAGPKIGRIGMASALLLLLLLFGY